MTTKKHTYTAIARERNTWNPATGEHPITWECGHKHRTLRGAVKCLRSMGNACCSYLANIERSDYDGYSEPLDGQYYNRCNAEIECNIW